MERKLRKGVQVKYLNFLKNLYEKRNFSVSQEIKDWEISKQTGMALLHYNLISGSGRKYKWIGSEPTMKEADEIREFNKQYRLDNLKNKSIVKQQSLFVTEEEQAVKLLKSLGYKIFKQFTDFREI